MQTDSFSTPDGFTIHTKYWQAGEDSRGVVIIVHGIAEHSGRYVHVAEKLVDAGYHVYALDHRGHGESSGKRLHISSKINFISDLKQFHEHIQSQHPDAKIFMLGHSMGSVISLHFILTYPDAIDAIVVTGTASDVSSGVSAPLRMIGNIVDSIYPNAPISPPGGMDILTRDTEMVKRAENDPLMYKGWTRTRIAKYILDTGEMIQERASEITMPILIMHGEDDELTPISGSNIMYERVGSKDKTLKIWENMLHEIMNEVEREAVLDAIVDWLNKH